MIKYFITFIACLSLGLTFGQNVPGNLVKNWSFDEVEKKIKEPGAIDQAVGWTSPTKENADLYSTNAKSDELMAPNNKYGIEEPYDGETYAGFRAFSYNGRGGTRSYIQGQLREPLKKDSAYCVRFRISLADLSKYACNNIGLALGTKPFTENDINNFKVRPQIISSSNKIQDEQYTWKDVCDLYIANGNEKYFVVGNFRPRDSTKAIRIKKPRGVIGVQLQDSYYYLENVSVSPIDSVRNCVCEKNVAKDVKVVYRKYESDDISDAPEKLIEYKTLSYAFKLVSPQEQAKKTLDEIAAVLSEKSSIKLQIIGHSDANEEKAMRAANLSLKRATKAKDYLVSKGILASRLSVVGKKNDEPKVPGAKGAEMSKNRRVEFKLAE